MRVVYLSWVWKVVYFCNKHFALDLFEAGEQASKETDLSYKGKGVFFSQQLFLSILLTFTFHSAGIRFNRWCADPLKLLQCTHITVKVKNPIQPMHRSTAGQLSADALATIYPSNLQDASGVCAFKNSSFRSHHIFKSQWSIKTFCFLILLINKK